MLADRLAEKLGIRNHGEVCVVDAPAGFMDDFSSRLPPGARVTDYVGLRGFDVIMWWPTTLEGLEARLAKLAYCIKPNGAIWLVIPKRQFSGMRGVKFSWAEMQAIALQTDLVDNKTVSISSTSYATSFIIREQHRFKYE